MRVLAAAAIVAICVGAMAALPREAQADPVLRALDALHTSGARGDVVLEALVAAGVDPTDWRGRDALHEVSVPPPGEDPIEALREAYAVLSGGADPTAWQDPVRGPVDLTAQLADNVPAALASDNDAVQSWQLLAMSSADMVRPDDPDVRALRERLLVLQSPEGAWGCGPWYGPECTGFALAGLHATGGIPDEAGQRAARYIQSTRAGDAFGDPLTGPGVQATAWAVQALFLLGIDAPQAVEWLLAQQGSHGMWQVAGRPNAWATAEVIVALAGGHPL